MRRVKLLDLRSVTSPGSTSATPQQEKAKSAASRSGRANATRPPPPPQPETVTNNTPSQAENRPALAQNPPPAVADLEAKVLELTQMLQTKQAEVNMLKSELKEAEKEMATSAAAGNVQLKELRVENKTLKTKLAQLEASTAAATAANSTASQLQPLSDTEKLLLGQIHQHSSAPASIAGTEPPTPYDALGTDMLASTCSQGVPGTPDWEHQSLGSCSEVSVAGLQDRILQMEETHYSTSEELQATLQELADLQNQLSELQSDNSRLTDEKAVVLQSLCKQTERLEDCRARVESLTALLCSEGLPAPNDTEAKLLEIIKGLHEERSEHQGLIEAAEARVRGAQERLLAAETASARQNERVSVLQAQVEVGVADKKRLEDRLEATLREAQEKAIEHDRIENLLANAKAKIEELEECRTSPANETQLESRLESIRSEKEELEVKIVELQEQLAKAQGEVARIRETTNTLQEELKVSRNNARSQVSELEFVINQEREETKRAQAASTEQAAQAQRHLEDKRQLRATLSEAQRENLALKEELKTIQAQLDEEKRLRAEENDEWIQFRSDLLMTVRVANDFKTEAQQQLAKLVVENKALKEKNRSLEAELTKAKALNTKALCCDSYPSNGVGPTKEEVNGTEHFADEGNLISIEEYFDAHDKKVIPCVDDAASPSNSDSEPSAKINNNADETDKVCLVSPLPPPLPSTPPPPLPSNTDLIDFGQEESPVIELRCPPEPEIIPLNSSPNLSQKRKSGPDLPPLVNRGTASLLQKRFSLPVTQTSAARVAPMTAFVNANLNTQQSPARPVSTSLTEAPPSPVPSTPACDAVFSSVQQEMAAAARRLRGTAIADNRLSVKNLIESIENATKHHKAGGDCGESRCSSASNSIVTTPTSPSPSPCNTVPSTPSPIPPQVELSKSPLRDQQQNNRTSGTSLTRKTSFQEYLKEPVKPTKSEELPSAVTQRPRHFSNPEVASKDPLWALVKNGGSKRNALLKWCQAKTSGYKGIDITNFSSSWNDGLALCALIHSYLPALVPYNTLVPTDKRKNFSVAFSAAESVGIPTTLSIVEMTHMERPDWQQVMAYVTEVYKHFET
ncbi:cytospin-A-like isoform X2 [Neocloeon triangulifer]|uniref:cytospin-A-like isoform X2 n=1 Tax=Neocloeon triangulifer TaxID=2078957 RepID=UPI00286F99F2|nr:cytospin-A-like isoform X2 [Neocloeon triangulifer]